MPAVASFADTDGGTRADLERRADGLSSAMAGLLTNSFMLTVSPIATGHPGQATSLSAFVESNKAAYAVEAIKRSRQPPPRLVTFLSVFEEAFRPQAA